MSSAEQNSSKEKQSPVNDTSQSGPFQSPPKRPTLVSPPKRPAGRPKPSTQEESPSGAAAETKAAAVEEHQPPQAVSSPASSDQPQEDAAEGVRYQPIAPPSEPMQYRAIGLVRGTYQPSEADQLNRGSLTTEDGTVIDSVLLGRVTSLIKKHLDLTMPHLWVVYPRTRRNDDGQDQDLHLQIVGVWEPETLGLPGEPAPSSGDESGGEAAQTSAAPADSDTDSSDPDQPDESSARPAVNDNYFSIRGEVVKYSPEDEFISVKILQGVRRSPGTSKPFKVNLRGTIEGRTIGYFWDFKAKRENQVLVLEDASVVGIVPPKKRSKQQGGPYKSGRGGSKRPMPARRSVESRGSHRPRRIDAGKDLRA